MKINKLLKNKPAEDLAKIVALRKHKGFAFSGKHAQDAYYADLAFIKSEFEADRQKAMVTYSQFLY